MASLQAALRTAGVSSAPEAKLEQPDLSRFAGRPPSNVLKRETLWQNGVIEIAIPKGVRKGIVENGDETINFLQFARDVTPRGKVNIFVHTDNERLAGTTITAQAEIIRKDLGDGRSFLYIDLKPVDVPATHRLIVEPKLNLSIPPSEVVFQAQTPQPLEGIVVIAPAKPPKIKKEQAQ